MDVTPLRRSREFRLLYGGQVVSYLGSQMTVVAAPFQVFLLTGSSLWSACSAWPRWCPSSPAP